MVFSSGPISGGVYTITQPARMACVERSTGA